MNRRLMLGVLTGVASADGSVQISGRSIIDTSVGNVAQAGVGYSLLTNGLAYRSDTQTGPTVIPNEWTNPTAAVGADYEVLAEVLDPSPPSAMVEGSAVGSWLTLESNRNWNLVQEGMGEKTLTLLVTIRRASDQFVVTSATIFMGAFVFDGGIPL